MQYKLSCPKTTFFLAADTLFRQLKDRQRCYSGAEFVQLSAANNFRRLKPPCKKCVYHLKVVTNE